ncbi:hypothetical protein [Catenovulum adriaticum]|uniref:Uncharacterized protein n=1 Tax=Catenovulum adriaticum TaxID=2984846 RepID=A0ABY7AJ66_9ALTE|nr:hypothetical protein [Catenovulum sp. TS8]WAJ69554.1 hypothetical protein OLW01_10275 [Catenovulum sp. TS8]
MTRGNSVLFVLIFAFICYRIIQPWFSEEAKPQKKVQSRENKVNDDERFFIDRQSENMPKLYAWQRLLQLQEANSEVSYFLYLDEWLANNPEQLFNKAFRRNQGNLLSPVQQDIIKRFTYHYKSQAQANLDSWFNSDTSEQMDKIVCQSLAEYSPEHLEAWFVGKLSTAQNNAVAKACFTSLLSQNKLKTESWFNSTEQLQHLPNISKSYHALIQTQKP